MPLLTELDSGDLGAGWIEWIIAHALMSEAKALIEAQPAAAEQNAPFRRDEGAVGRKAIMRIKPTLQRNS